METNNCCDNNHKAETATDNNKISSENVMTVIHLITDNQLDNKTERVIGISKEEEEKKMTADIGVVAECHSSTYEKENVINTNSNEETTSISASVVSNNREDGGGDDNENDNHHNQTTDEKVVDVNKMEKTMMTNISDNDNGNDHHQKVTTTTTTVRITTTSIDKKVLETSDEEKSIKNRENVLVCSDDPSDETKMDLDDISQKAMKQIHTIEQINNILEVNTTPPPPSCEENPADVGSPTTNEIIGSLTYGDNTIETDEKGIELYPDLILTDDEIFQATRGIDIDLDDNDTKSVFAETPSSSVTAVKEEEEAAEVAVETPTAAEVPIITIIHDDENTSTLTTHDTLIQTSEILSTNILDPANIVEKNMQGDKEDKSRPPSIHESHKESPSSASILLQETDKENMDFLKKSLSSSDDDEDREGGRVTRLSLKRRPKMKKARKLQKK